MKTILHATDFSAPAVTALKYAHALSMASGGTLVVMHVFDIPTIVSASHETASTPVIDHGVQQLEKVRLKNFCRQHLGEQASKGVRLVVKEGGEPAREIIRTADEVDADAVVVGTRGQSKIRDLLLGSTTRTLLRECGRVVVLVPANARANAPLKVAQAIALDGAGTASIKQGLRFCDALGAKLTVVHAAGSKDTTAARSLSDLVDRVRKETGRNDIAHEFVRADERTIAQALNLYLHTHGIDLLMMLEHKDRGLFDALFGSDVIASTAFNTPVPTLVMHEC